MVHGVRIQRDLEMHGYPFLTFTVWLLIQRCQLGFTAHFVVYSPLRLAISERYLPHPHSHYASVPLTVKSTV